MEAINAFIAQYGALMAQGTWDAIVMTVLSTLFAYVIGIPVAFCSFDRAGWPVSASHLQQRAWLDSEHYAFHSGSSSLSCS